MRNIGIYLVLFGAGSFILNSFGYEFKLLMWIDNWGVTMGNIIRIAAVVGGAVLFFMAKPEENEEADEQANHTADSSESTEGEPKTES